MGRSLGRCTAHPIHAARPRPHSAPPSAPLGPAIGGDLPLSPPISLSMKSGGEKSLHKVSLTAPIPAAVSNPFRRTRRSQGTRGRPSVQRANAPGCPKRAGCPGAEWQRRDRRLGALTPRSWGCTGSCLRDGNYFENRGQRPQAHICNGLLTRVCHGPSQSESNFINTVIKQEGNYSKYWKNVRVTHELRGDRILFDTQGINDAKEMYSEVVCTVPPAFRLSLPAQAPGL